MVVGAGSKLMESCLDPVPLVGGRVNLASTSRRNSELDARNKAAVQCSSAAVVAAAAAAAAVSCEELLSPRVVNAADAVAVATAFSSALSSAHS